MMHTTLAQLRSLKLDGLAADLEEQLAQPGMAALSKNAHLKATSKNLRRICDEVGKILVPT